MVDRRELFSRAILATASIGLLTAGGVLAVRSSAAGDSGPHVGRQSLPSPTRVERGVDGALGTPLIPVSIDIPVRSAYHPHGVHARVTAHPLNPDQSLYVPADPSVVNWAAGDAAPGSPRGTVIISGHINDVLNGHLVIGAFADLAEYADSALGAVIIVHARGGREVRYRIVAGREYAKGELAADPALRAQLYDQVDAYGGPSHPSSRLLLVSCGGPFDPNTGEYRDNVFLYALPVS